jgi:hypothetical protein
MPTPLPLKSAAISINLQRYLDVSMMSAATTPGRKIGGAFEEFVFEPKDFEVAFVEVFN